MNPPSRGPDGRGDRGRGADQGIDPVLGLSLEISVDEGLHGGQQERGAKAADHGPEDDDREEALGQRHRHGADGVADKPDHVGAFAPDQVADFAADQDKGGGYQRLERDRRLEAADGRADVLHHGGDRDVHDRGVDNQHEHRHRQQQRESAVERLRRGAAVVRLFHLVIGSRVCRMGCSPQASHSACRGKSFPAGELAVRRASPAGRRQVPCSTAASSASRPGRCCRGSLRADALDHPVPVPGSPGQRVSAGPGAG